MFFVPQGIGRKNVIDTRVRKQLYFVGAFLPRKMARSRVHAVYPLRSFFYLSMFRSTRSLTHHEPSPPSQPATTPSVSAVSCIAFCLNCAVFP